MNVLNFVKDDVDDPDVIQMMYDFYEKWAQFYMNFGNYVKTL